MTASITPWTASGMKENNEVFRGRITAFLRDVVSDAHKHARFMNMLSMLEHLGSRKIMLSQMNRTLTEDSLKHLAEEARHAYFFKRNAERVAGCALDGWDDENTMCRIPSAMYFGRMDANITKAVGAEHAYGWVSLIIELRACWLYAIYQDVLKKAGDKMSLRSLLAEEDLHLAEMFALCGDNHDTLRALSGMETKLFEKLLAHLEDAITDIKAAA